MNSREQPKQCESKLCCRATASLRVSIEEDKKQEDKSLAELLDNEDKNGKD